MHEIHQHFIKKYEDRIYRHATMVRHQGTVVAFAMDKDRRIHYSILQLDAKEEGQALEWLDKEFWSYTPQELLFPSEIDQIGYSIVDPHPMPSVGKDGKEILDTSVIADKKIDTFLSSTARLSNDAPFQVLSDENYIYLFRESIKAGHSQMVYKKQVDPATSTKMPIVHTSLLLDRFLLSGETLERKIEVRYQRSRNKYRPQSNKDSLGAKDMEGRPFYEPTHELDFVGNLYDGRFRVLLLPTAQANVKRWQIFTYNTSNQAIDTYNIARSKDGLFNRRTVNEIGSTIAQEEKKVLHLKNRTFLSISPALSFNFTAGLTIEGWINSTTTNGKRAIISFFNADSANSIIISSENEKLLVEVNVGTSDRYETELAGIILTQQWIHLAITIAANGQLNVYVNGELQKELMAKSFGEVVFTQTVIGANLQGGNVEMFEGYLHGFRIWELARSGEEIEKNRWHTQLDNQTGLVSHWPMDEGRGDIVFNRQGDSNGTIYSIDSSSRLYIMGAGGSYNTFDHTIYTDNWVSKHYLKLTDRHIHTGLDAVLYYQQEMAPSGYDRKKKPVKRSARVMLALGTSGIDPQGEQSLKNYVSVLDFAVSTQGTLANLPNEVELLFPVEESSQNPLLEEIQTLEALIPIQKETLGKLISKEISPRESQIKYIDSQLELSIVLPGGMGGTPSDQAKTNLLNSLRDDKARLQQELGSLLVERSEQEQVLYKNQTRLTVLKQLVLGEKSPRLLNHVYTDKQQLTVMGCLLDFAVTKSTPGFFDSSTGKLTLYYRGEKDVFYAAYFDTRVSRSKRYLNTKNQKQFTLFSLHPELPDGQSIITIDTSANTDALDHLKIEIHNPEIGLKEIWNDVPRDTRKLQDILNGESTDYNYAEHLKIELSDVTTNKTELADQPRRSLMVQAAGGSSGEEIGLLEVTGSVASTASQWITNSPGLTLTFPGSYIIPSVTEAMALANTTAKGDHSLEAWVYPSDIGQYNRIIYQKTDSSSYGLSIKAADTQTPLYSALVLNGQDAYVSLPKLEDVFFVDGMSIEAWVYFDSFSTKACILDLGIAKVTPGRIIFSCLDENLSLEVWSFENVLSSITADGVVALGKWVHVAATVHKDGTAKLFVDGEVVKNGSVSLPEHYFREHNGIGINMLGDTYMEGQIYRLKLWNLARTNKEVAEITGRLQEPGLLRDWYMDNDIFKDHSGGGYHGVLQGNAVADFPNDYPIPSAFAPLYQVCAQIGQKSKQTEAVFEAHQWAHLAAVYRQSYALAFNGVDDFLSCKNSPTLNLELDLSIEIALQLTSTGKRHSLLVKGEGPQNKSLSRPYALYVEEDGRLCFEFDNKDGESSSFYSSAKLKAEGFNHIAIIREAKTKQTSIISGTIIQKEDGETKYLTGVQITDNDSGNKTFSKSDGSFSLEVAENSTIEVSRIGYKTEHRPTDGKTYFYIELEQDPNASVDEPFNPDEHFEIAPSISIDQWVEVRIYIDGILDSSHNYEGPDPMGGEGPLLIGKTEGDISSALYGAISEIRLWNKAITPANVDSDIHGREEGMVSWWRFDENEGNVVYDVVSNNNAIRAGAEWIENPDIKRSDLLMYVNGILQETKTFTTPNSAGGDISNQFTLGGEKSNSQDNFKGHLEETRIWSVTRTPEQILDNLFGRLKGEKADLLAYYPFDQNFEENNIIRDHSLWGNHLPLDNPSEHTDAPRWILSTAPISDDTAMVRSALSGVATRFQGGIHSPATVLEYGDLQYDQKNQLSGVLKRCYTYIKDGKWELLTGYKVGDLITEWISQVQADPQLIGYIEGAPPVPGENLTGTSLELGEVADYGDASSIELEEAEQVVYQYGNSSYTSSDWSVDFRIGGGVKTESEVGTQFFKKKVEEAKATFGGIGKFEHSMGNLLEQQLSYGRNVNKMSKMGLRGTWEKDGATNADLRAERRYVPKNRGFALVQSDTMDVFAMRLAHNNAFVAYRVLPNPDIPKDWNIITFPITPTYTKQGTLDGKLGCWIDPQLNYPLRLDEHYPQAANYGAYSYFKPLEAYILKKRIEREQQSLQAYYQQQPTKASTEGDKEALLTGKQIRNLVNTYVWTADGGFFAETTQLMEAVSETTAGTYSFLEMGGLYADVEVAFVYAALEFNLDALFGSNIETTKSKAKETEKSFGLSIEASGEGDIQLYVVTKEEKTKYDGDTNAGGGAFDEKGEVVKRPGKVDAYRFMTFYLEPDTANFDDFFERVVDPVWLSSGHPNAVALRQAQQKDKKPKCWRVMHRVTFVSRVLPPLSPGSPESIASKMQAVNIDSNWELIKKLEPYVRHKTHNFVAFTDAVRKVLKNQLPELLDHEMEIIQYAALYFEVEENI